MHDRAPRFGVAAKEAGGALARKTGKMATCNVATVRCAAGRRVFHVEELQAVLGWVILRRGVRYLQIPIDQFH